MILGRARGRGARQGPRLPRAARRAAEPAGSPWAPPIEGVDQEQARAHLHTADTARTAYVRRLYRADPADPSLYHLVIDSTAIPLDAVIELILAASRAQVAAGHRPASAEPGQ